MWPDYDWPCALRLGQCPCWPLITASDALYIRRMHLGLIVSWSTIDVMGPRGHSTPKGKWIGCQINFVEIRPVSEGWERNVRKLKTCMRVCSSNHAIYVWPWHGTNTWTHVIGHFSHQAKYSLDLSGVTPEGEGFSDLDWSGMCRRQLRSHTHVQG